MKLQDSLKKAAELLELASATFEAISSLTSNTKDDKAADVLKVVTAMANVAKNGFDGVVAVKEVQKELGRLRDTLKATRDAALDALHRKFDSSEKGSEKP